jgi:hypothetical protein
MDYFYQLSQPRPSKTPVKKDMIEPTLTNTNSETKIPITEVDEGELDQLENKMKGLK